MTKKLTKRQAAIIGAYTGVLCGRFSDMHEYVTEKLGRQIFTHEFASEKIQKLIEEKTKDDFLAICNGE